MVVNNDSILIKVKCAECGAEFEMDATRMTWRQRYELEQGKLPRLCRACYITQKRAEEARAIDALNAELPALTGSEKQIAWAKQIRAKYYFTLQQTGDEHIQVALMPTESKWWIDNRNMLSDNNRRYG